MNGGADNFFDRRRIGLRFDTNRERGTDRFIRNRTLEVLEDLVGFFFVLDARIFLSVAAQTDPGL